ncbi:MAG: hypothetical protein LBB60_02765, partial [Desulfovibrio sp.]|nr:hypothetical protein [Desulfovibrio sp.]
IRAELVPGLAGQLAHHGLVATVPDQLGDGSRIQPGGGAQNRLVADGGQGWVGFDAIRGHAFAPPEIA